MAYIGQGIKQGTFKVLDTSGNTYNGSNTTFSLGTQVGSAAQLLVSHDGVIQLPGTDYTLASGGASITFSTAPASGASIFIVRYLVQLVAQLHLLIHRLQQINLILLY